jgi:mono/diheme cytochrome c family protein
MSRADIVVLLVVIFVPLIVLWGTFIARTGRPGKGPRPVIGIPRALRPGAPDEVLEGPRLERVQWGGFLFTVISVLTVVFYWFPEAPRQEAFASRFDKDSVHRGGLIFKPPAQLPEGVGAVEFKEIEEGVALGMGCASCHSDGDQSSKINFTDPVTGKTVKYMAPPLGTVFQRWDEELIRFTIERGRPGTPMPTWGVQFGGPMTSMMVNDVIAYLKSLPGNQTAPKLPDNATGEEIFVARCAVCHGPQGSGKEDETPETEVDSITGIVTDYEGIWYQGMALWGGDVTHLSEDLHFQTIVNGRRYAFMPAFGEAPPQGIPVPPYPLTDEQIKAVMAYERSLLGPNGEITIRGTIELNPSEEGTD